MSLMTILAFFKMFKKWDIVQCSRFPETVQCKNTVCKRHFSIFKQCCEHCQTENNISSIVAKTRPVIVWIDQTNWHESMAFGIPLSATKFLNDNCNQMILLQDYIFSHADSKYHKTMRAMIHQSTRIDGNVLHANKIIGTITDKILQDKIENKLLNWLFK